MCAPDPPPAPDYAGAAQAQGQANVETAQATSRLNNPNVVNPYGTQTWREGAGPSDRPTMTQTFSPEQQLLYDQQIAMKSLLGGVGTQGARSLGDIIGRNVDLSGMPPTPGSAAETRDKVINSMMARVNEDVNRQADQKNSDLIAAGIRPGTKAYDDAMALTERIRTDARQQAILSAGQEAQRDFGIDSERRRNRIAELLTERQTPLNEINALMSGSQVDNPFAVPGAAQNTNISPPPIFGAAQAQYESNLAGYNAQQAGIGNGLSGLFSLGGAALKSPWLGSYLPKW